jgi:L-cysteine S-thiosulfotransferase
LKRRAILLVAALAAASASAQAPSIPEAFARADTGNCLACHAIPASLGRAGGEVGPPLTGSRMRELGATRLRAVIEDPMANNGNTTMPPYGRHHILQAAQIDSIVRFLQALPDGEALNTEAAPDAQDGTAPAALERGRTLWLRKFKDKRSLSGCFPNGGRRIAALYPQYDARAKRVFTLEMAINQCLRSHREELFDPIDPETMGAVVAYMRSLSAGQKIAVKVPAAAQSRLEEGRRLYFTRLGQRNFACASCHLQAAGKRYGETVLAPLKGQAAKPLAVRKGKAITLQAHMRECLERMGAAPFAAGSDELNLLEYFVMHSSNGVAVEAR